MESRQEEPKKENSFGLSVGKPAEHEPTSIVVTHLPTDSTKREIEDFFSQIGLVRRCHLVRDKDWQFKGMVYVQYVHWKDAASAKETLHRRQFKGSSLRIKFSRQRKKMEQKLKNRMKKDRLAAMQEEHYGEYEEKLRERRAKKRSKFDVNKDARKMRKGRIIVRNLSFKVNEEVLQEHFSPYGKINEVKLVRKDDNQLAGYAFLQYETKIQALKAIKECNMKPLLGRHIAVDIAVPKKMFDTQNVKSEDASTDIKEEEIDVKEELEDEDSDKKPPDYTKVKIKDEESSDDGKDSGLEDKDDSEDDDEDESGEDSDDDGESEEEVKPKPNRKPPSTTNPSKDVAEERTVFIKNLSFDATEEDVSSVLSQFGELKYVLICIEPLTEHSRGTAFAQFKEKEAVTACLAAETDPATKEQFVICGRPMHIMKAMSRGILQDRKKDESEKKVNDKRNLYLAREGFVRRGTQAAVGVSEADMNLRTLREQTKRRMLKNLNIFLSRTRLCVNNLSEKLDDAGFREMFSKHAEQGAKITEARIMRNLNEIGGDGKPMSRGYGFINFTEHEHALAALRKINNNPSIFTKERRPIVEFSMENLEAIQAREKRLAKSREKNPLWNKGKNNNEKQQKGKKKGEVKKTTTDSENTSEEKLAFMGSKSDALAGVKNALPANIGAKVRARQHGDKGKITRKQLKKQRQDRAKGTKRLRVFDNKDEPVAKKFKEGGNPVKEKKKKIKKLPKTFQKELQKDTFANMVKQYKQKMTTVSSMDVGKKWYDN